MVRNRDPKGTREEMDFLGKVRVPDRAYYGVQTVRAKRNFLISGLRAHPEMVRATVLVKKAASPEPVTRSSAENSATSSSSTSSRWEPAPPFI